MLKQQLHMLREVRSAISALSGAPTKEQVIECCCNHPLMKHYSQAKVQTMRDKLDSDSPKKGPVDMNKLFEEDSDGNQLAFVECLRHLCLRDREEYLDQLVRTERVASGHRARALLPPRRARPQTKDCACRHLSCVQEEAICEQDPEHDGLVNVVQLRTAVQKIDPDKEAEAVDALIRLGLMIEKTVRTASRPHQARSLCCRTVIHICSLVGGGGERGAR